MAPNWLKLCKALTSSSQGLGSHVHGGCLRSTPVTISVASMECDQVSALREACRQGRQGGLKAEFFSLSDDHDEEHDVQCTHVQKWLAKLGLGRYASILLTEGFDDFRIIRSLGIEDVIELSTLCGMLRLHASQSQRGIMNAKMQDDKGISPAQQKMFSLASSRMTTALWMAALSRTITKRSLTTNWFSPPQPRVIHTPLA